MPKQTASQTRDYIIGRLDDLTNQVGNLETAIGILQARMEIFFKPKNPGNDHITFKWVVEKFFMPLAIIILAAVIAGR